MNSLKNIRFSIQQFYLEKVGVDIIDCSSFNSSNICFANICKILVQNGKGATEHHAEIEPEDMQKLYNSFDLDDPQGLQFKVWMDVMLYMCRRGREGLREMTKSTFGVAKDATGRRYVYQLGGELDKNHGVNDGQSETNGEGRMYETKDRNCPVSSYLKYISHLHPMEASLWQRPLEKLSPLQKLGQEIWFYRSPVGEKLLGNMMPRLSEKYGLSQRYTNHSVRVTSMQLLEDSDIEGRHIQRISGHKSLESINSYAKRLSAARKRNISQIFSHHTAPTTAPTFRLCPDSLRNEEPDIPEKSPISVSTININSGLMGNASSTTSIPAISSAALASIPIPFDCNNCQFTFHINSRQ